MSIYLYYIPLLLILALYLVSLRRRGIANLIFSVFVFSVAFWVATLLFADSAHNIRTALFWSKAAIIGPTIAVLTLTFFSYVFPEKKPKRDNFRKATFFFSLLATPIFVLSPTSLNIEKVVLRDWGAEVVSGYLYSYLGIFILLSAAIIVRNFYTSYKFSEGIYRQQILYTSLGALMMILFGAITNLLLVILGATQYAVLGPASTLFFIFSTLYAIVRYRFLDIRVVITRSLIYALLVSFVTGSFVLITFLGSEYLATESQAGQIGVLAIASLLIVVLLEPLKKLLAKTTNKIFFKAAIDYDAATKSLTNVINEELELDKLVKRFTEEVEKDLRLKQAILLLPVGEGVYMVPEELISSDEVAEQKKKRKSKTNTIAKTPLLKHLHDNRSEVIVIDEIDGRVADAKTERERKRFDKMRNSMEDMHAYAAVPIPSVVSHDLEAILILSRKKSGEPFSAQDIQLLQVIAPQMASGIQKARLFQEAKQFNVKLQREIDKATKELRDANEKLTELDRAKSEFMSIASHQLRTPLAGIIGYLSMIEDGDFGKINAKQKPIIHDVVNATQRLIRMVNIFLNVTRIEAGRFVMNYTKQPFADVIEAIYKELKPTADKKGVELIYKKKELPIVEVDADKIKDVILNLVDNAIKYSPEGRVEITAEANTRSVHVMIKDSGVGIAPKEAKNLFSKFVRGSGIARVEPNGSGLGLFIAKKITEGHGGKIWAESEGEGKGSTFQFKIPLRADKEAKKKAEEFKKRAKKA